MVGPTPVPSSAFDGTPHGLNRLMAHKTGQPSFTRLHSQMFLQPPQATGGPTQPHELLSSDNSIPHPGPTMLPCGGEDMSSPQVSAIDLPFMVR